MSRATIHLPGDLHAYLLHVSVREPEAMRRLRRVTAGLPEAEMQIAPEQAAFMALLVELAGARRCLEIGTFTGYSALAVARVLPEDGRLVTCDVNEAWIAVGRPFWAEAGVARKIDVRVAPALETLDALIAEGRAGSFDFVFIDADKEGYASYYERALTLVRRGGLVAADNTLWKGEVADPNATGAGAKAIRAFNAKLRGDERVSLSLVPIGDGLTLARRR